MTDIMPCLWFDNRIDEAIEFYTSTFKSAKVHEVTHQDPNGPAFTAVIELEGHKFMLLNGGPQFKFTEAVSFMINVDGQEEVDYFWNRLTADGGEESQCGWCKDKFGLSRQVVPKQIYETVLGKDPAGSQQAMQAMLKMGKLVVDDLQKAYAGA
ncbi:VOC family protein [Devosia sp. A8/3-2]|nr:VOC family protein [Devosia sp. A8/3-2]